MHRNTDDPKIIEFDSEDEWENFERWSLTGVANHYGVATVCRHPIHRPNEWFLAIESWDGVFGREIAPNTAHALLKEVGVVLP